MPVLRPWQCRRQHGTAARVPQPSERLQRTHEAAAEVHAQLLVSQMEAAAAAAAAA